MLFRKQIGNWLLAFTFARVGWTEGLTSRLRDDTHILQWEFDNIPLDDVINSLRRSQMLWSLPNIYVIESSLPSSYHAISLYRQSWASTCEVISGTKRIDMSWFKGCCSRGFFTLRIGLKNGRLPKRLFTMKSPVKENVKIEDLTNYIKYQYWILERDE